MPRQPAADSMSGYQPPDRHSSCVGERRLHPHVAPRVAADMELLSEVERLPHEGHASLGNAGEAQGIEARPRQERVAAAKGPDLDALRRPDARPAGMEADGVGDDKRVGRNGEGFGCAETETG